MLRRSIETRHMESHSFSRGLLVRIRIAAVVVVASSVTCGSLLAEDHVPRPDSLIVADSVFQDSDWELVYEPLLIGGGTVSTYPPAGTSSAQQTLAGGDGGAFRTVTVSLNSPTESGYFNSVYGFHRRIGAVYDPSQLGPITSIDYSESSATLDVSPQVSGCLCQEGGVALRQGGSIYYGPGFHTALLSSSEVWEPRATLGVDSSKFWRLSDGAHPDFSMLGGPIEFGFYRANGTGPGPVNPGYTTVGGVDNVQLKLRFTSYLAVPNPVPGNGLRLLVVGRIPTSHPITFSFSVPSGPGPTLTVFDAAGRRVRTLISGNGPAGAGESSWDLRSSDGTTVPSGVYLAVLRSGAAVATKRVLVIH